MSKEKIDPRCQIPAPEVCPNCGSPVEYTDNSKIYGRAYGKWPYMYLCKDRDCDSYIGVHPGTRIPLGFMANREIREARKRAHAAFDPLWKTGIMRRGEAYGWLAEHLGIERWQCHIGWFDVETCRKVVSACKARFASEVEHQ